MANIFLCLKTDQVGLLQVCRYCSQVAKRILLSWHVSMKQKGFFNLWHNFMQKTCIKMTEAVIKWSMVTCKLLSIMNSAVSFLSWLHIFMFVRMSSSFNLLCVLKYYAFINIKSSTLELMMPDLNNEQKFSTSVIRTYIF